MTFHLAGGEPGSVANACTASRGRAPRLQGDTVTRKVTEEDAWVELHGDAELLTEIARARRRAPSIGSQMTSGCLGYQGKEACDAC
jgi:hypothetical protein